MVDGLPSRTDVAQPLPNDSPNLESFAGKATIPSCPALHNQHTTLHDRTSLFKIAVVIALGIIFPALLLLSAHQAISKLDTSIDTINDLTTVAKSLPAPSQLMQHGNDYALLFGAIIETGTQKAIANRMRMKIAVMHIGFAISCVGLMLMLLGVDSGETEIGANFKEVIGVNLKFASSGIAVFVLGAGLAGAGGLITIEVRSGEATFALTPIPNESTRAGLSSVMIDELKQAFKQCDIHNSTLVMQSNCRSAVLETFRLPAQKESR